MSGAGSLLSGFAGGYEQGRSVIDRRKKMDLEQDRIEADRHRPVAQPASAAPMRPVARGETPPATTARPAADKDGFIQTMMPHAIEVGKRTGLDPRLIIAQAAQETGWGRSAPGNNYFGIKSHGQAGGNTLATDEVIDGQRVRINDSFRAYGDMAESVQGYGEFLQSNPRYSGMLSARDLDGQLEALASSGYATDPNYASSVGSIARSIQLPEAAPPQVTRTASAGTSRGVIPATRTGQDLLDRFYK